MGAASALRSAGEADAQDEGQPLGAVLAKLYEFLDLATHDEPLDAVQKQFVVSVFFAALCQDLGMLPTGAYDASAGQLVIGAEDAQNLEGHIEDNGGRLYRSICALVDNARDANIHSVGEMMGLLMPKDEARAMGPLPWPLSVIFGGT